MSVNTKNTKNIFTRITLDEVSLNAVRQIQLAIPNFALNDAVKMLLGVGVKNLNSVIPAQKLDKNGFNEPTKARILESIKEFENGEYTKFATIKDLMENVRANSN